LEPLLEAVFREHSGAEWLESLRAAGIPSSLVRNFQEVAEDEQARVREMFPEIDHARAGRHRVTGTPVKLSETPGGPGLGAPGLGEHTERVLQELLGLHAKDIGELKSKGVIYESGV
jgi:crotonobetainyl-CoA:carnitine CoA-transferase CaiB-like acyl-CoA transferase